MSHPLDHRCPKCDARPGERCWRHGAPGPTHDERRGLASRELRPYDVPPAPVPAVHQEPERVAPNEVDGLVAHHLDERTRAVGLAGVDAARAALARHRWRDRR